MIKRCGSARSLSAFIGDDLQAILQLRDLIHQADFHGFFSHKYPTLASRLTHLLDTVIGAVLNNMLIEHVEVVAQRFTDIGLGFLVQVLIRAAQRFELPGTEDGRVDAGLLVHVQVVHVDHDDPDRTYKGGALGEYLPCRGSQVVAARAHIRLCESVERLHLVGPREEAGHRVRPGGSTAWGGHYSQDAVHRWVVERHHYRATDFVVGDNPVIAVPGRVALDQGAGDTDQRKVFIALHHVVLAAVPELRLGAVSRVRRVR